jgi:catechol 2,3-dioxygenase-like lactoylglutathione lyase family enzyme
VRSVDGGWRVAAQIVERFLDLNENSERLFAVPEVGLNPSVVASGDGGSGFSLVSIDNIGVSAVNRQRSVAFYELLGLSRVGENDRGTTMSAGNAKIFVFETSGGSQGQTTRSLALFDNAPGLDHISLEVDDVDRAYASLRAAGVAFASEPETYDWGARAVATRDPDGTTAFLLQWVAD